MSTTDSPTLRRLAVRQQVIGCTACSLRQECRSPVPFSGPAPASIAVVGEAPGKVEDRDGRPFWGPAGQLARRWLVVNDIDPRSVGWVNTCSCWPSVSKTPKKAHIEACEGNLISQLELIDPKYVLVMGSTALHAFHPELQVSKARGNWWVNDGRWHMATYHPAAVLRNKDLESFVLKDLELFKFFSLGVFDPYEGQQCVGCWRMAEWWRDLLGYCKWHKPSQVEDKPVKVSKGMKRIHKDQGGMF